MSERMDIDSINAKIDALLPTLPGWCTPEKGRRLARLVIESRAESCVELGVFGGRSLVAMAYGLASLGRGRADGIDPYEKTASLEGVNDSENDRWWSELDYEDILRQAAAGIEQNGLGAHARIVRARSLDVVSSYDDGSIDLLHQDSNHSEAVSTAEVGAWMRKLRVGGFWVFDDVNWATTQQAQAILAASGFDCVESHETWAIFQSVGSEIKGRR